MAISSVTKGNVITTAKINEIITAANGAGVSLSVSGTTLYLKNEAGTNLSNVSVVAAALPAGTVVAFAGNPSSAPTGGFLLCNGAAVSRTTYAALFAVIGTTYGEGNGTTSFNLPRLTNHRFIMGSGTAGQEFEAGLPELTGWFSLGQNDGAVPGADGSLFKFTDTSNRNFAASDSRAHCFITTFSAQNYNAIYGNAETVQPPAVTMRYYIKF